MNFQTSHPWRNRRNHMNHHLTDVISTFGPLHFPVANYGTQTHCMNKEEINVLNEEVFLKHLQTMPKSIEKLDRLPMFNHNFHTNKIGHNSDYYPSIKTGITNFFSGVFNMISGSIFQRSVKPTMECPNEDIDICPKGDSWQSSNLGDQNKNKEWAHDLFSKSKCNSIIAEIPDNWNISVQQCDDKHNMVHPLLANSVTTPPKIDTNVQPEIYYECLSSPEEDMTRKNEIESENPSNTLQQEAVIEDRLSLEPCVTLKSSMSEVNKPITCNKNFEFQPGIVTTCEDKMSKLKAMLESRRKINCIENRELASDIQNEVIEEINNEKPKKSRKCVGKAKTQSKRFKNPNRLSDTKKKSCLMRCIQDDMRFAQEIESEILSSPNQSPNLLAFSEENEKDYFDEVSGRFPSTSTVGEDDAFQIVFSDVPKVVRTRTLSDCDSEDSFIIFEDSPDSCYTSADVFGDESTDSSSDYDTSDSESDSDSGCGTCNISHYLSRTISDLTDDSLYEDAPMKYEDQVDSSPSKSLEINLHQILPVHDKTKGCSPLSVLPASPKIEKPVKRVHFSPLPPKVHVIRVWAFAARQARIGHWGQYAIDRDRFKRRIADVDVAVSWVLKPQHRSRVMFQRFMPWWNAEKRRELDEKKREKEEIVGEENIKLKAPEDTSEKQTESAKNIQDDKVSKEIYNDNIKLVNDVTEAQILKSHDLTSDLTDDTKMTNDLIIKSTTDLMKYVDSGLYNKTTESQTDVRGIKDQGALKDVQFKHTDDLTKPNADFQNHNEHDNYNIIIKDTISEIVSSTHSGIKKGS